MELGRKAWWRRGQSTVEFAVVFPLLMVVAVVGVNALLFFGECASFDRVARQTVRTVAASPAYGQSVASSCSQVESLLADAYNKDYLQVSVQASGSWEGYATFVCTLTFSPTLFGLGLKDQVFGVPLPKLHHQVELTVDVYKPGVLL
ncbi:MAG: hypothetical protein Q4E12_00620 [Coriobacteriia bacterium]|nr:hypothetical protein [Coriobacteriia bacterium]